MAASGSDTANDAKPSTGIQYAWMFQPNKSPTAQLDALLRSIATYICREIGDKNDQHLTPTKLAAFYKTVGGDYDSLFKHRDHTAISYMWQVTGCQHSLVQEPDQDYGPPKIPALSLKGFSRWEALELLLGPEEHVPFIQYAVKNWNLKHPVTGEVFPVDLPASMFPAEPDAAVDAWHKTCAAKMWEEASTEKEAENERERGRGSSPEKQGPKFSFSHVDPNSYHHGSPPTSARGSHARSERGGRPLFMHVPRHGSVPHSSRQQGGPRVSPERPRESPSGMRDDRRRRSFSDIPSPVAGEEPSYNNYNPGPQQSVPPPVDPKRRPGAQRRHSQPRHFSSESSDGEHLGPHRKPRYERQQSPPTPPYSNRRGPNSGSHLSTSSSSRPPRTDVRDTELRRHGGNSPRGSLRERVSDKVSSLFPGSRPGERPHSDSRQNSYNSASRPQRRAQPPPPPPPAPSSSRTARVESDLEDSESSDASSSEDEQPPRRRPAELRAREEREREYLRDRGRRPYALDNELDDDLDSPAARKTRQHLRRPDNTRRTSSHADVDRRRTGPAWDLRDKERERAIRDERKRYERRSPEGHGRRSPSPLTGVSGRRYPAEAAY